MLIDLLSTSNLVSFNIKVAEVLGLHQAIYIAELMNINDKAIRKNKMTDNHFTLDRNYMTTRTTITETEQLEIEAGLKKVGILTVDESNPNNISLDIEALTSILMSPDEKLLKDVTKLVDKKANKRTKADVIKDQLKKNIVTTNKEMIDAYSSWIDSVFAKNGWMSKKAVVDAQTLIDTYTNKNLDLALKIIGIADINAYRDMQWAINNYEANYKVTYKVQQVKPVAASEVKVGKEF